MGAIVRYHRANGRRDTTNRVVANRAGRQRLGHAENYWWRFCFLGRGRLRTEHG